MWVLGIPLKFKAASWGPGEFRTCENEQGLARRGPFYVGSPKVETRESLGGKSNDAQSQPPHFFRRNLARRVRATCADGFVSKLGDAQQVEFPGSFPVKPTSGCGSKMGTQMAPG